VSLPRVVFGIDGGYVQPLCVALVSVWEAHHRRGPLPEAVILHADLDALAREPIERLAGILGISLEFVRVSSMRAAPVTGWWSAAIYLRLAIPDVLGAERVALYLDADTLVLDHLGELLATDVTNVCLGAVRDPLNPVLALGNVLPGWRQLGLTDDTEYFNSGVLLINLEACRANRIGNRCLTFLVDKAEHARFPDQDSLNFVVGNRWLRLPRRWNTFPLSSKLAIPGERYLAEHIQPLSELLDDEASAGIMHYVGAVKPWSQSFPPGPARDLYRRFSDRTDALLIGK
jgi:lipopolysaccharide biosynthesis glycosyltransferase